MITFIGKFLFFQGASGNTGASGEPGRPGERVSKTKVGCWQEIEPHVCVFREKLVTKESEEDLGKMVQ